MPMTLGKRVLFVGIGGFGMSAIARILLQRGIVVSGSDRGSNAFTTQLASEGATIFQGHAAANVGEVDSVIISSAINPENPEVIEAHTRGIPVYKRANMLSAMMAKQQTIAIAGTHGKTTTTAMVAHILLQTGNDPSYIVGGVMANTGDNAHSGNGQAFVIEADEYDNMFHGLNPHIAVVTSLEYDHPDFFPSFEEMTASFQKFADLVPPEGTLIVCADNASSSLQAHIGTTIITYGIQLGDIRATNLRYEGSRMKFDVLTAGEYSMTADLGVYGEHNALNVLAAALAAGTQGVDMIDAFRALETFAGTGRRFEVKAEIHGIVIVDDYAHHPTAIATTVEAARQRYPHHALWAVWQPHTFSRTLQLRDDYATAFSQADHVLVTDIFASREAFSDVIHSRDVVVQMQYADARYSGSLEETAQLLIQEVKSPSVVLIMSAGDAPKIGDVVATHLTSRKAF